MKHTNLNRLGHKKSTCPKEPQGDYDLPATTSCAENNGIGCYVPRKNATIFKNCISLATNAQAPIFYQPNDFTILQDSCALKFKDKELNRLQYLYLVGSLKNVLKKFNWNNKSSWDARVKFESIPLPTIDGKIAFDFMESYIKELEAEQIRELEAYLEVTGLKDYELDAQEREALAIFASSLRDSRSESKQSTKSKQIDCHESSLLQSLDSRNDTLNIHWHEFSIGELFSVKSNPQLNKDSFTFRENGEYPYFTRTVANNGISGYVDYLDEVHKIKGGGLAVGMLGMQFFYMDRDFYAGQFTKTCYPKFERFNQKIAHFFIAWLNKNQAVFQGVLVRDFEKVFEKTKILLPVNQNNEIAFDFMEKFISAVQKEVIKSVVLWSAKRIETTKAIVANHH